MSELSEEKIIKNLKKIIDTDNCWLEDKESADEDMIEWAELEKLAIQGLLDLYQKEKEKDRRIKDELKKIVDLYDNTLQCTRKYNDELANILCDLQELLEERN